MTDRVDILLYVALSEEAESVLEVLGDQFQARELKNANLTAFIGTIPGPTPGRDFNVAMVPAGKMGNTRSASTVSLLIKEFEPADVVVVGIAGSLTNEIEPGDVFIPDSVNEYLANSATSGEEGSWTFLISGSRLLTSRRLLNRFQCFARAHKSEYREWQTSTRQLRSALISATTEAALINAGMKMRGECKLYAGDDLNLASGPAVGKGRAFLEWIKKDVDRKAAAMEMETAGVYDAALIHIPSPRTIALRGISDYADARKAKIEKVAKGIFRALSAKNATLLFIHAVKAGLFEVENLSAAHSVGSTDSERLDSWARSVYVIGGETGETADVDSELPQLHRASLKLGRVLARAGAHLVVCSPFPDSADYYVAMGYADANGGGTIHFHSPTHPKVEEKRQLFRRTFGANLTIQDWDYPAPETEEDGSWSQAWLLAQLQALEKADVVIALGGRVSKTASTLLHLAEAKGLPIIPFAFLGGVARRIYCRRDWARLNPGFDSTILDSEGSVEKAVSIANRLVRDRVRRSIANNSRPKTIFISVARQDSAMGVVLGDVLMSYGIEALFGESEIMSDQLIPTKIEQAIRRSDIVAILWSRFYAQSPWCYDELALALSLEAFSGMKVWLFNLDDSSIVPTQARKLPMISVRSEEALRRAVKDLIS
ncbi:TIR domain-containing protein [Pseudomonas sp. MH2]|uniref:TIR domain-containing protein n=1 Tax=Pseudomonas machongensis TaxID=3110229 RepID=A0ABU5VG20_9PSED|nr:TIR domain-containing protein [Pseudomonas sp. MH2]MEA5672241.1 TIR domain-containing protein [Pseudomonas sp. MH2]